MVGVQQVMGFFAQRSREVFLIQRQHVGVLVGEAELIRIIISSIIAMPQGLSILGRAEVTNMAVGPSAPPIMPTFDICSFLL